MLLVLPLSTVDNSPFSDVRSFEHFKHLQVGMLSEIKRKTLPAIAKAVGESDPQALHHFVANAPWQEAPTLARQCGLRERSIPLVSLIYILVLGWWHQPKAGPSALARFATTLGMQVGKQDLDPHFTHHTTTWLLALLQQAIQVLVCAHAVDLPLLRQFSAVVIEDGSSISLPSALQGVWRGCGGSKTTGGKDPKNAAGLTITVRWDLLGGGWKGHACKKAAARHCPASCVNRCWLKAVCGWRIWASGL